jgi:hypothetical protein
MAYTSVKALVDAELAGQSAFHTFRKVPNQATAAGVWFDLSMSPGNPVPNYYAATAVTSVAMRQSVQGGIPHGGNVAQLGQSKFVKTIMAMTQTATAAPLPMILCDYQLFYPFVDMSITDWQAMTNTVALPRPTATPAQIMAVIVAAPTGASIRFRVQYTNSAGVTGRLTPLISTTTQIVNGTIISGSPATALSAGPFLPLQPGDRGVSAIEAVQFETADVGLLSFVLVSPVESLAIRTIDAPVERVPFTDMADMPIIVDDAYLNLICYPNGSLQNANINGYLQTVWG